MPLASSRWFGDKRLTRKGWLPQVCTIVPWFVWAFPSWRGRVFFGSRLKVLLHTVNIPGTFLLNMVTSPTVLREKSLSNGVELFQLKVKTKTMINLDVGIKIEALNTCLAVGSLATEVAWLEEGASEAERPLPAAAAHDVLK
jgi:hypothetical protein